MSAKAFSVSVPWGKYRKLTLSLRTGEKKRLRELHREIESAWSTYVARHDKLVRLYFQSQKDWEIRLRRAAVVDHVNVEQMHAMRKAYKHAALTSDKLNDPVLQGKHDKLWIGHRIARLENLLNEMHEMDYPKAVTALENAYKATMDQPA